MSDKRSIGTMTILNVIGAVVGVASSILVARFFGVSREIEIYFAATGLQQSILRMVQTGQLTEAFLPIYHQVRAEQGQGYAFRAFSIIVNWMLLGVILIGVSAYALAFPLMRIRVPGFGSDDILLASQLFQATLPLIVFQVTNSMLSSLANAEKLFGKPEAIGVGARIASIAGIIALVPVFGAWGMIGALWMGTLFSFTANVVLISKSMRYRHAFVLAMPGFDVRGVFSNLIYTLGYTVVTQIYSFALDAALSELRPGIFAIVRYVQKLYAKVSGIFLRPVSTVYFTRFSEGLASGMGDIKRLSQKSLRQTLFICSFVIAVTIVTSRPGLSLLWGSDRFPQSDINYAAFLLSLMFICSLVQGWSIIARKAAVSLGLLKPVSIFGMFANIVSAAICVSILPRVDESFVPLVVVGTPVFLQIASAMPLFIWKREFNVSYDKALLARWTVCIVSTVVIALALMIGSGNFTSFNTRWSAFLSAAIGCVLSVGLLLLFSSLARISEATHLVGQIRHRFCL